MAGCMSKQNVNLESPVNNVPELELCGEGNITQRINLGGYIFKPGRDNNGKPGNQVATKSLPFSEIFAKNLAFTIIYVHLLY